MACGRLTEFLLGTGGGFLMPNAAITWPQGVRGVKENCLAAALVNVYVRPHARALGLVI